MSSSPLLINQTTNIYAYRICLSSAKMQKNTRVWGLDPSSYAFISALLLKFPRLLYHHRLPFY